MAEDAKLELITKDGKILTVSRGKMTINCQMKVSKYVHVCKGTIDERDNEFHGFRSNDEVKFYGKGNKDEEFSELFHGITENAMLNYDNESGINKITFVAYSFARVLALDKLEKFEMEYQNGFGEVVKKLVESYPILDPSRIQEEGGSGKVYFDKITPLDAIMQLAYSSGWCMQFIGKQILFEPCTGFKDSGKTITSEETKSGSIPL